MPRRIPQIVVLAIVAAGVLACAEDGPTEPQFDHHRDGFCLDADGDGVFAGCTELEVYDCDDADASKFPGNEELCNGIDDDCDGLIDEDVQWAMCPLTEGVCANARLRCRGAQTPACDAGCPGETCPYGVDWVADETEPFSRDGVDNDCDGEVDENYADRDGDPCGNGCLGGVLPPEQCACKIGGRLLNDDGTSQCLDDQGQPVIFPFAQDEVCANDIDDNCDGEIDEAECM